MLLGVVLPSLEDGFVPHGGGCVAVGDAIPHCVLVHERDGYHRYEDGFVLANNATCEACTSSCPQCFGTPPNCIACHNGSMPVTDDATNATTCRELGDSCRVVLQSSGGGCAVCQGGYFR